MAVMTIAMMTSQYTSSAERFAGDFLMLGSGARSLAMGSAAVAITDDATSGYYNPAGLTNLSVSELNLMHSEQFGGLENYNTVSFATPLGDNLYGGVSVVHVGVGDIKYTRLWDPSKALSDSNRVEIASREDAADYAVYFSAGKRIMNNLSTGASVKLIRRSIGDDTAFGYGIDAGMQYMMGEHWIAGVNARDITGTTIAWDGKSDDRIAATVDAGLANRGDLPFNWGSYIITASMLFLGDSPSVKGLDTMHIGVEYLIGDFLAIRAGASETRGSFGIGLKRLPLISSSSLDYALLSHEELDRTHRVSMSIRF